MAGNTGENGTRNGRGISGRTRLRMTPALTSTNANKVPMWTSSTMALRGTRAASRAMPAPKIRVSRVGVPVRGSTSASRSGMSPSRAMANMIRVGPYRVVSMTLVMATRAPKATSAAAQLMPAPSSRAKASGASLSWSSLAGRIPTAVTETSTYTMVAISGSRRWRWAGRGWASWPPRCRWRRRRSR
jgi:hypothetical protein